MKKRMLSLLLAITVSMSGMVVSAAEPAEAAAVVEESSENIDAEAVQAAEKAEVSTEAEEKADADQKEETVLAEEVKEEATKEEAAEEETAKEEAAKETAEEVKEEVKEDLLEVDEIEELEANGVVLSETNFPDASFRNYLKNNVDTNKDGALNNTEISAVYRMDIRGLNVKDLTGIKTFTNLKILDCSNNSLTYLNLSNNTNLQEVRANFNNIETVNVSPCLRLRVLEVSSNRISSLNITKNVFLETLDISDNGISALDLSNNYQLKSVNCGDNKLTSLNVTKVLYLEDLCCEGNLISSLDLTNNTELNMLICSANNLTSLNVTANRKLKTLDFSNNKISSLNISTLPVLEYIYGDGNRVPCVNLSSCSTLKGGSLDMQIDVNDWRLNTVNCNGFDKTKLGTLNKLTLNGSFLEPTKVNNVYTSSGSYKYNVGNSKINMTVTLVFLKEPVLGSLYNDVSDTGWRFEAIRYVTKKGIMNGISGTKNFEPESPITRAMFATIMYRMKGSPATTFVKKFSDVGDGAYYSKAVTWASSKNIIYGHSNSGLFGTYENITREDMAVILYRYAAAFKYSTGNKAGIYGFKDASKISSYAVEAMKWAVGNGIMSGRGTTGYLDPKGKATRAEAAAMVMRFMRTIVKAPEPKYK